MLARELRSFLKRLEEVIPPPDNQHHSLTFGQFVSDASGSNTGLAVGGAATEELVLSVREDAAIMSPCIFLNADDMSLSVESLVKEVKRIVDSPEFRQARKPWPLLGGKA